MPMQRSLYPRRWRAIAKALKEAKEWTCEHCGAKRGEEQVNRHGERVPVQIGVAHLDHDPWNVHARLAVLCRRCHIRYDVRDRRRKQVMMQIARGQLVLPGLRSWYQPPRLRTARKTAPRPRRVSRVRRRAARKEGKSLARSMS